jgi:hypothetical protein
MIRIAIPAVWRSYESESEWVQITKERIAHVVAHHPGYESHDIEVDYMRDLLWLYLTPLPDYEMDEGL